MQLLLQGAYLHFFPDLRSHVERRIAQALTRCKDLAARVTVTLKNGRRSQAPAGWTCAIRVLLRGRRSLRATALSPLPSEAIDGAVAQISQKAARLPRPKSRVRGGATPAQPMWGGRSLDHVPVPVRTRRQ